VAGKPSLKQLPVLNRIKPRSEISVQRRHVGGRCGSS
jgi:hypothetical protein